MAFENLKSTGISYLLTRLKGYLQDNFLKHGEAVTSVNGNLPDENGNATITSVPLADNLNSSLNQTSNDSFVFRTSGGSVSIKSGDSSLTRVMGDMIFAVEKTAELQISGDDIDATIDEEAFFVAVAQASESGTVTFSYSSAWDTNPANYGITVTGTPASGNTIVVTYNKGEIAQSNPQTFVSTGWNLYNNEYGYARVTKYSSDPDEVYGISGAYTSLQFSATIDGERSALAVNNGKFDVISDGYVWVTGGDNSTTEIWMTWKDWGAQANGGVFEPYTQEVIDISEIMSDHFANGLLRAGNYRDEINLTTGKAYSRVARVAFSGSALTDVKSMNVDYVFDGSYIYYGKQNADQYTVSPQFDYYADDHGTEFFTDTVAPVYAEILYGQNLKNKLERDVVTKSDLVNNLTSDETTKALTAKQGKILSQAISGKVDVAGKTLNWNTLRKASVALENNCRYLVAVLSANENSQALVLANCGSSGSVNALVVSKGSNLTVTTSSNRVWFEAGSTVTCRAYWLKLGGNE